MSGRGGVMAKAIEEDGPSCALEDSPQLSSLRSYH
jgi:hypothetical protein